MKTNYGEWFDDWALSRTDPWDALFREWLRTQTFQCQECGQTFRILDPDVVNNDDRVLCHECLL